ncbi:YpmS family protein [Virgibacillus sp. MSJ-26]|uniref:YpmS family protein n=1 Tax=Virgibacillus sp. MSJ-26 TaxID=2841522 RepID=UPI001C105455|nr:YpmS family protein [Virgibacillus sp. MSJ-26]MBU5466007.1 YpmS family protein [Virgibacillus sp. MSJ-26]
MTEQNKKMSWKRLFYILLTVNVAVVIVLFALIFWPVPEKDLPKQTETTEQRSSEFVIRTTKENLNELMNAYLSEWLKNTDHQYRVSLEDDVHLIGELPVFSSTVPLSVHLEPIVQDNGDVVLKQKSISLGLLELPNKKIMEYIDKYLPMPDWVIVNPSEEEVYVAVTEMDIRSNFEVAIEHIDLEVNNLALKIKVPYESLGIDPAEPLEVEE